MMLEPHLGARAPSDVGERTVELSSPAVDQESAARPGVEAPWVSYAQNGEDVFLRRCFTDIECGFWIDVGGWMPREDSVTYALSQRGWRGINIEPVPANHAVFVAERPRDVNLGVLAGSVPGERTLYRVADTGLSTSIEEHAAAAQNDGHEVERLTVAVRTLDDIWNEHVPAGGEVHVLKIDAEGAEGDVLAGLDLRTNRPWVLCIEANLPNERERVDVSWEPDVLAAGYVFVFYDGLNQWFVAEEHRDLARHFSSPINVFDNVIAARAQDHMDMLERERQRLESEVARLESAVQERTVAVRENPRRFSALKGWLHR